MFDPQQVSTGSVGRPDLAELVLNSLNAGVYVTDLERRIVYWNQTAQQLTGWRPKEIIGKACHEQVLCHVDKDDRPLCGKEFCPLHRAITTGTASHVPIVVFALSSDGKRVPMRVSVAPLRDGDGNVIGGVETFMDLSGEIGDLQRAQRIQSQCLLNESANDPRVKARLHYAPCDVLGGDFCALSRTGPDRYGFILADVMGHGLPAALYTMYLRSLWDAHRGQASPAAILRDINQRIAAVMSGGGAFATAVCGVLDIAESRVTLSSAGGPAPLLFGTTGNELPAGMSGTPMGLFEGEAYDDVELALSPGDRLLLFSDGVVEIADSNGNCLESDGLVRLLREIGYPSAELNMEALEEQMLMYSNSIRFADDVTLLEIRLAADRMD